ncbi:MAG: acyl-CoA carboxylase subunit beta [Acidimicrobiales bacterium]
MLVEAPAPTFVDTLAPVGEGRGTAVEASIADLHGHAVGWFRLAGGDAHGALGPTEGEVLVRLVHNAVDAGVPIVGVLDTGGADVRHGVASLHAWGEVARALSAASGVVPVCLVVVGACVSGPALLLGLADIVVVSDDAIAYVSGPATVEAMTSVRLSREVLGGAPVHTGRSGVAHLLARDEAEALDLVADVLSFLPPNVSEVPPVWAGNDPAERRCERASAIVPSEATASYDVRDLVAEIVDDGDLLELRGGHAPNIVTGLARLDGRPVGVVANQPRHLAGTLDIEASSKGARFVRWCDAFGLPIVTLVDTPGFLPGVEQEWRGMIRHGAELVHAYAMATVPRLCVVVRKAYGGAYIVMDSKGMGNDLCVSWPAAELAVMGASGAVEILHRRTLRGIEDPAERAARRAELEADYTAQLCTPRVALERGYVDRLIDPADTRAVLARGLRALAAKRERLPRRKHDNSPL